MTPATPPVLYISADTSGPTTQYKATPRMHPGADAWVPKETLDALVAAGDALEAACIKAIGQRTHPAWIAIRAWRRTALAALPAPDEGGTMETVVDGQIWHERRGQLPDGDPRKPKSRG